MSACKGGVGHRALMGDLGFEEYFFSLMDGSFAATQMGRERQMQAAADIRSTRGLEDRSEWRTDSPRGNSTAGTASGWGRRLPFPDKKV